MNYIKKDITTVNHGIIAHGVNCQRVMGSGVAKAIKNKWPVIYDRYMEAEKGEQMLGTSHIINIMDTKDCQLYIANCYTQEYYGKDGKQYASLEAIESALDGVFRFGSLLGLEICSPMIGCGLGGLKWESVSKVYFKLMDHHNYDNVTIYYQ